jgi:hypothetical protein
MYGRADGMPSFQLTMAVRALKVQRLANRILVHLVKESRRFERSKLDRPASRSRGRHP